MHVTLHWMKSTFDSTASGSRPPHVLVLPKWYPHDKDPQLGDFVRKQVQAVASHVRTSVVFPVPVPAGAVAEPSPTIRSGVWELLVHYPASTSPLLPWRKLVNLVRYWRAMQDGIRRCVAVHGLPDLVHVHVLVRPAVLAWWVFGRRGVPFIVTEHSSGFLDGGWHARPWWVRALSRSVMRRAALVTAVSEHLAAAIVRAGLCKECTVVPNVVPGTDRPLGPAGPAGGFMVVADLVDRTKNVGGVLRALALTREKGHPFTLTVVGGGPDRAALEEQGRLAGMNGAVQWLGRLPNDQVLDRLAAAGSLIVNSRVETFSVVTGEALALGRPVIATRCGGPEAFITEANGWLVPVDDDAALAGAMVRMAQDHARFEPGKVRATLGAHATPEAVGRRWADIYQRILDRG